MSAAHHAHSLTSVARNSASAGAAIASDAPVGGVDIPVIGIDDVGAIADFIVAHTGLAGLKRGVA